MTVQPYYNCGNFGFFFDPNAVHIQDCSIPCFRETWLIEKAPDKAITLDSYSFQSGPQHIKAVRLTVAERPSLSNKSCYTD